VELAGGSPVAMMALQKHVSDRYLGDFSGWWNAAIPVSW
jgi:hypothetical protein